MSTLEFLPDRAAPTFGLDPELDATADELLARYRRDVAPKVNDPDMDYRFNTAVLFLLPFLSSALPSRSLRALEIGCGKGSKTVPLSHIFSEYLGFDFWASEIDRALNLASYFGRKNIHLWEAAAADIGTILKKIDGKIDVIILYAVLEHLTVQEKLETLRTCWEYLDDDGYLFIGETPNRMVPIDYHSSRLIYFQQMPMDLWKLYYDRTSHAAWRDIMTIGMRDNCFELKAYRTGLHVGHQEFELAMMDLPTLERHIVADNYHPAILNQYPYETFEFAKLTELTTFGGFPPWASIKALNMPAFFSRYYLEVLLGKNGGRPGNGPVRGIIPRRGQNHVPSEVVKPTIISNGEGFTITAEDLGITPGSNASITVCLYHPGSEGEFSVTTQSGRIVIEEQIARVMNSISRYRQNLAIGIPTVGYHEFPLNISTAKGSSLAISYVFGRDAG